MSNVRTNPVQESPPADDNEPTWIDRIREHAPLFVGGTLASAAGVGVAKGVEKIVDVVRDHTVETVTGRGTRHAAAFGRRLFSLFGK